MIFDTDLLHEIGNLVRRYPVTDPIMPKVMDVLLALGWAQQTDAGYMPTSDGFRMYELEESRYVTGPTQVNEFGDTYNEDY